MMEKEINGQGFKDNHEKLSRAELQQQLDYKELFMMFAKHRKIKLLRYLFQQPDKFKFSIDLFVVALEI